MELKNVFALRRSCRSYTEEQLTEAEVSALLDAALLSPAAMGRFDKLHLTVVQDPDVLDALNDNFRVTTGNAGAYPTYHAPTVIFVSCDASDDPFVQAANAACVVEQMSLAAAELGLGSVYLLGVCRMLQGSAQVSALLGLPQGFQIVSALAVGHASEPAAPRAVVKDKIAINRV